MNDSRQIVEGIRTVLKEVSDSLPPENVTDAAELLDHAEWGLALSLICTQLYEYDVVITRSTYTRIEWLGHQMEMPEAEWTILKSLIK